MTSETAAELPTAVHKTKMTGDKTARPERCGGGIFCRPLFIEAIMTPLNQLTPPTHQPYLQQFSLTGKIVLITGAARDIGLEIACALAGSGAHVILNGRNPDTLAAAVQDLASQGLSAAALAF